MRHVVVLEDEPHIGNGLRDRLPRGVPVPTDVTVVATPRDLAVVQGLAGLDCAIIDLSLNVGNDLEIETGVDAIDLLVRRAPRCRIVVCTRNDQLLIREMVVAIRQTWPGIPFLHKGGVNLDDQLRRFVDGVTPRDDDRFSTTVAGVVPLPASRIAEAVRRAPHQRVSCAVLLALANRPQPPSARELADQVLQSRPYVKRVLQDCGTELRYEGFLAPTDQLGVERLWPWSRARRPILERVLKPLG